MVARMVWDHDVAGSSPVTSTKRHPLGCLYYFKISYRGVAQLGRALRSGRRGRKFKSCHLDQKDYLMVVLIFYQK